MQIYDITKFASQSNYKPELNCVYVKHTEDKIKYVATDTFRLVEISFDSDKEDPMRAVLKEGFYSLFVWRHLAKSKTLSDISERALPREDAQDWQYPDYEQIMPKETIKENIDFTKYDINLLTDFVKMIEKFIGKKYMLLVDTWSKKESNDLLYFERWNEKGNSFIKFLLMPLNK
jgi:hypothetical protein